MLVDTSLWVRHLRGGDAHLAAALERAEVWTHPWVVGELACGRLSDRATVLGLLRALPAAPVASVDEALLLVERRSLMGRGIGWVDVQLLASALLAGIRVWTLERWLAAVSAELGVAAEQESWAGARSDSGRRWGWRSSASPRRSSTKRGADSHG